VGGFLDFFEQALFFKKRHNPLAGNKAIKALGLKVQSVLQDRQIRVTGGKRDDLQKVIAAMRAADFEVALAFQNFRD
jgi:uncharacterized protein YajQ (UPF0234 family)